MQFTAVPTEENPLCQQLAGIFESNPESSRETREERRYYLGKLLGVLWKQWGLQSLHNLKAKHLAWIFNYWKERNLAKTTSRNKLCQLRWLLRKVGKAYLLAQRVATLEIGEGARPPRPKTIVSDKTFSAIIACAAEPKVRALIRMARLFGMRFREAALFRPHQDIQDRRIFIKRGALHERPRFIWIVSAAQRELVWDLKNLISDPQGCLADSDRTFFEWKQAMYYQFEKAGLSERYGRTLLDLRLTFASRELGRLISKGLPPHQAGQIVSRQLGYTYAGSLAWCFGANRLIRREGGDCEEPDEVDQSVA